MFEKFSVGLEASLWAEKSPLYGVQEDIYDVSESKNLS